ncbi:hypothetical protein [Streptomyces sp. NPDC047973]|uniref:hypothetical protein n=1 Tax=Streptomyces sp. NPDC047973 TaxID=3155383 RepID=UPI00344A9D58
MTDRIERTEETVPAAEHPRGDAATNGAKRETAPAAEPGRRPGRTPDAEVSAAPEHTPGARPGAAHGEKPGATAGLTAVEGKGLNPKRTGSGEPAVPSAPRTAPAVPPTAGRTGRDVTAGTAGPLVPRDDQDKLAQRMQHAVTDFVESPRRAVEEAESTFDQIVSGLTEALTERKRVLRASWQEQDTEAQTEELRIALQRYRDLGEQLLKI